MSTSDVPQPHPTRPRLLAVLLALVLALGVIPHDWNGIPVIRFGGIDAVGLAIVAFFVFGMFSPGVPLFLLKFA